jgi:predicted nucleotidyltransferase
MSSFDKKSGKCSGQRGEDIDLAIELQAWASLPMRVTIVTSRQERLRLWWKELPVSDTPFKKD